MDYKELKDFDELIDAIVEWIGKKWTKSMIKRELREVFPGIELRTLNCLYTKAKRKICELYNIDPLDYKGSQISFYESVIRGKNKIEAKLTAAERLDRLFGLEHISGVDPSDIAKKIVEFKKAIEETIIGVPEDVRNKNGGSGQNDANAEQKATDCSIQKDDIDIQDSAEDNEISKEDIEKLKLSNEEGL